MCLIWIPLSPLAASTRLPVPWRVSITLLLLSHRETSFASESVWRLLRFCGVTELRDNKPPNILEWKGNSNTLSLVETHSLPRCSTNAYLCLCLRLCLPPSHSAALLREWWGNSLMCTTLTGWGKVYKRVVSVCVCFTKLHARLPAGRICCVITERAK